jgi:phosphoribosylglycinamide formyltransferase 1
MSIKNAMLVKNVVVLISGRGSNLDALLKTAEAEHWERAPGAHVVAVISNRGDAEGLAIARLHGVPTQVVAHADFAGREDFERALAAAIDAHSPALVVLAGFMRVLTPSFVERYAGRMINIHPSLLPLFPGLDTHRRALEAGVRVHGATVHFVSADVDSGAIIAQAAVAVLPGDDADTLAARVLVQEHRLLPRATRMVIEGRARCDGGRVVLRDVAADELALLGS